jgi:hypothetical protein
VTAIFPEHRIRGILRLAVIVLGMVAGAATAAPHRIRVDDPPTAKALLHQGARLVADYGGFQILDCDEAPTNEPAAAHLQSVDHFNFIQLNAGTLNTRASASRSLRRAAGAFTGRRLHLVQFAGPIKADWLQALEQTGARVVSYLPQNAYLVYGDAQALAALQSWAGVDPSVQWEGAYHESYKMPPLPGSSGANSGLPTAGTNTFAIQLVADDEANAVTRARIDQWRLGPVRNEFRVLNYDNLIVRLPAERVPDIAAEPDVVSVRPYVEPRKRDECQDQILAGNLAGNSPSGPGYLAWLAGKGFIQAQFDASGLIVNVSDSGIDNGTTSPGHFGLYRSGKVSQGSRVAYSRLVGTANPGNTLKGCDGHGTLNAHIIAGYCDFDGFPFADAAGFRYGLGVCPFVKVGASVIFDTSDSNTAYTYPNFSRLETQAYTSGAHQQQ